MLLAEHFYLVDAGKFDATGTTPCNCQCYNDHVNSQFLGQFSHYTCPDKCVHWSAMCRGVSFCDGDEEVCGEDLRCPWNFKKYTTATVPVRSYCFGLVPDFPVQNGNHIWGNLDEDDGAYDNIDRSDEDINQTDETGRYNINYTALEHCTNRSFTNLGSNGIMCDDICTEVQFWCYEESGNAAYCKDAGVSSLDSILCSNHTFWQNISCFSSWIDGPIQGKRCTGTNQHCYYPEREEGPSYHLEPDQIYYPRTCSDKSDRIFETGQHCPPDDTPENCKTYFGEVFPCPLDDRPARNCWDSCDNPGPNCTTCTNSTYFHCTYSNHCLHPQLRCDGHPQCEHGEDEDLDVCEKQYKENKVISKYATFRCKSIMYPIMEIYATACNDFPECVDGEDERLCFDNTALYIILPSTMGFIAIMYLVLKFGRYAFIMFQKRNQKVYSFQLHLVSKIHKSYLESHGKVDEIDKINSLLLHIIFTKSKDEIKDLCCKLYAFEEIIHEKDKCEIYCCLYKNLDPLILENIFNSQFPGIFQKVMDYIGNMKLFSTCLDFIDDNDWIYVLKNTIIRLVKVELEYLDILKDSFLAFSLYKIIGGYEALNQFPANFSSIVVLCFLASVVVPILFATLHLAIYNPYMIFYMIPFDARKSKFKKLILFISCCILSFLNPVLLVSAYEGAKEKTRKLAKTLDTSFSEQMIKLRCIKSQWAAFIKIELGKFEK